MIKEIYQLELFGGETNIKEIEKVIDDLNDAKMVKIKKSKIKHTFEENHSILLI